jgi:predicted transcriptional regulator of viral defense system
MVTRGRLERVAHGVYRVPQVIETEFDRFQLAVLWAGVPETCLSHDTALVSWGISDTSPDRIHLSVGRRRRLRRTGGDLYFVHRYDVSPSEVTLWHGIRTTDVATSIAQCIESGVPANVLQQALERAGREQKITPEMRARLQELLDVRSRSISSEYAS